MDVSKLDTIDDKNLLDEISVAMKEDKQAKERMLFLINRCDEIEYSDRGKKENIQDIVKHAKKRLKDTYDIDGAQIIPISAKTALYQGYATSGKIDSEEEGDLARYRSRLSHPARDLASATDLSATCRKALENTLEEAIAQKDIATETLIRSGIYGLQLTINEYLEKYAIPHKTGKYLEGLERQLNDLKNQLNFGERLAESDQAIQDAEEQRKVLEGRNATLVKDIDNFRTEIEKLSLDESIIEKIMSDSLQSIFSLLFSQIDTLDDDDIPLNRALEMQNELSSAVNEKLPLCKEQLIQKLTTVVRRDMSGIYHKVRNLVASYKESLERFSGFDADSVANIIELSIELNEQEMFSVQDAVDGIDMSELSYSKREVLYRMENPARKGFFGFFKIWEKKWLDIEGDVTYVRKDKLSKLLTTAASSLITQSREPILRKMNYLYGEKKQYAMTVLEKLKLVMTVQTQQMDAVINQIKDKKRTAQTISHQQGELEGLQGQVEMLKQESEKYHEI